MSLLLDNVSAVGAGDARFMGGRSHSLTVIISGVATVVWEVTNDPVAESDPSNAEWHPVATITESSGYTHDFPWAYSRARVSSYTSGNVTAVLQG